MCKEDLVVGEKYIYYIWDRKSKCTLRHIKYSGAHEFSYIGGVVHFHADMLEIVCLPHQRAHAFRKALAVYSPTKLAKASKRIKEKYPEYFI